MINASIVIYKNSKEDLHTVINCTSNSNVKFIYIIDNSPTDKLREFASGLSSKIIYMHGQGNVGYGAAHNIAIKESIKQGAKYHLVLNPDIAFEKGTIEKLVKFMNNHQDIGLVMPKVLYPNGDIQYLCKLLPTPADLIFRRFLFFMPRAKKREKIYELQDIDYSQVHFGVPSLSGCFMLLRADVLKKIGIFDDRYFMYLEDYDLCRRIHAVSQTAFYPIVSVIHHYEKGSYSNFRLLFFHICSAIKYFNKWGWFFDKGRGYLNNQILNECLRHKS
ncbi:MAG: glycosyltransferase family 2 protein [Prevotellaceae bacterium]|jgi:GT2 family glycosyltransferase|nr:glycosyltransferase family 2 protein [Prevotellaceae bacterium]